ncbi:ATP-binding cassette sub-family C member 9-like [Saccoglossus kowalevskii]
MDDEGDASGEWAQWFCGKQSAENDAGWNHQNTCTVDLINASIHLGFLILAALILLVCTCSTRLRRCRSKTLITLPYHDVRYILAVVFSFVFLCSLGEGILTDLTRNTATEPHLYVPQALACVNGIICLVYYHHLECWDLPRLALLLLIFWISAVIGESLKLYSAIEQQLSSDHLRWYTISASILLYGCYAIIEICFILSQPCCAGRKPPDIPRDLRKKSMLYHHRYVNLFSRYLYWWISWLLRQGYKHPIEKSHLGCLPDEHRTRYQYELFKRAYEVEETRAAIHNTTPSMWRAYFGAYGRPMIISGILKLLGDLFILVGPVAIGGIVTYAANYESGEDGAHQVETPYVTISEFFSNGFVLVAVMFLSTVYYSIYYQTHFYICTIESMHVRTAIQAFVYEKSLRLSSWTMTGGDMTVGQITNHMSTDAINVLGMFQFIHFLWTSIIQIIVILVLLYFVLGVAALLGALTLILISPIQLKIGTIMTRIHENVLIYTDDRLKKSNELLHGIKLLKLYGWEELFCSAIEVVRKNEIVQVMKEGMYMAMTWCLTDVAPLLVTLVSYAAYYPWLSDTPLTPDIAFASLALFQSLIIPFFMVPIALGYFVNGLVSTNRLEIFFAAAEIEEKDDGRQQELVNDDDNDSDEEWYINQGRNGGAYKKKYFRENIKQSAVEETSMKKEESTDKTKLLRQEKPTLYGTMNKTIFPGHDTAVHSIPLDDHLAIQVKGGYFAWDPEDDSAILSDIDLDIHKGKLTMIVGTVGTGKSSILSAMLGEMTTISGTVQFNGNHGNISYCSQKAWLQNATLRDNILFGEQYNNDKYQSVLSACALHPDIDILPAGDLTEIGEKGINLSGGQKQRVSVARAIYSNTDIVILDDPLSALDVHVGRQLFMEGIIDLLIDNKRTVILVTHQLQYLQYADKIVVMDNGKIHRQGEIDKIAKEDPELYKQWRETVQLLSESESETEDDTTVQEREELKKQISVIEDEKLEEDGKLIEEEERERGSISLAIYMVYSKAVKIPYALLAIALNAISIVIMAITNFWLSEWSEAGYDVANKTETDIKDDNVYYLGVYTLFTFISAATLLLVCITSTVFTILAAKRIHHSLLRNIIHAPMRFFDTTPIGRILNRFSSDTQIIDQRLWQTIYYVVQSYLWVLVAIVVNTIVTPFYILFIIPITIVYFLLQTFFIRTSRELQRIDSITKSPVFAHFSETLTGLSTVRAYRIQKQLRRRIIAKIDDNNIAFLFMKTINIWLGIRLDFIGSLMVLLVGLIALVTVALGSIQSSWVGLTLTYALAAATNMNWMVRQTADMEMQMNAVERVNHYTHLDTEDYEGNYYPRHDWPDKGEVKLENVCVRYATTLDPVLNNITLHFRAGEKIGICGRTGSGKSSLTLALFRMIDTFQGRIMIDGLDISHVPLLTLRNRLAIIPQDPVLFTGSIRFNLDPEKTRTDDELWAALEIAQLKTLVSELDNQLDSLVTEGGENFSVGQRQLFCLARAFLRKARVLVMDEATASIDMQTDAILQSVVSTAFADRTVITIAHRISSILDADTVLVLSDGNVVEYDTPKMLLDKEDSMFSSLVKGNYDQD